MKKFALLVVLSMAYLLLVPTTIFAQSRLIGVGMGGGSCSGQATVVTQHYNAGGTRRVAVRLIGPGGVYTEITRMMSTIGNVTATWQFDASEYVVSNAILRVRVGLDGSYNTYYFDCSSFELAQQGVVAVNDFRGPFQRNTTYDIFPTGNDISELAIVRVGMLYFPAYLGGYEIDGTTIRLTTANAIGNFVFTYQSCNLANNCDVANVYYSIINSPPDCDTVEDTVYYWARDAAEAPFIGTNGVEDPDGDPLNLQITSLTNAGPSGDGGILYDIEYTVEDTPPWPGTPLSCSGSVRVRKDD